MNSKASATALPPKVRRQLRSAKPAVRAIVDDLLLERLAEIGPSGHLQMSDLHSAMERAFAMLAPVEEFIPHEPEFERAALEAHQQGKSSTTEEFLHELRCEMAATCKG